MLLIEDYDFGLMSIGGRRYREDLIVFQDQVFPHWWREEGHSLCFNDLEELLNASPEVLVIGTGFSGAMKVPESVKHQLSSKGLLLHIETTRTAWQAFNRLAEEGRKVAGAFHLTC